MVFVIWLASNLEQNVMALRCGKFGDLRRKQMPNYVKALEAKAP